MCGIIGYYCFSKNRPTKEFFSKVLIKAQARGKDATGIAYVSTKGNLVVAKQPIPATEFVTTEEYNNSLVEMPKILIAHTRAMTQGPKENNKNNHPIFTKSGYALVHNGNIRNDHTLFRDKDIERDGWVDSEILVKLLELGKTWDKGMELTDEVIGSYACAAICTERPSDLLLYRNTSPLHLVHDEQEDILYFSSDEDYILDFTPTVNVNIHEFKLTYKNTDKFTTWVVDDETGVLISNDIKMKDYKLTPSKYDYNSYYQKKKKGKNSHFPVQYPNTSNFNACSVCHASVTTFWDFDIKNWVCRTCSPKHSDRKGCEICGGSGPFFWDTDIKKLLCTACSKKPSSEKEEKIKKSEKEEEDKVKKCYVCDSKLSVRYDPVSALNLCTICDDYYLRRGEIYL